jgi:hypothetical protein
MASNIAIASIVDVIGRFNVSIINSMAAAAAATALVPVAMAVAVSVVPVARSGMSAWAGAC